MHRDPRPDEAPSHAIAATRSAWWHLVSRVLWATALVSLLTSTLSCRSEGSDASPRPPGGSIRTLTAADTILVTDLVGSVLAETDGTGAVKGRLATYPFGATRFDTSSESQKYAGSPRDGSVALDHMGARFYAAELGVWTSPDPLATTDPERLVTSDFAAANPYAYAKQSPVIAADRDGHFWHVAVGAAVGALVGGGMEAGRQYFTEGKVSDWGRVGAAAAGGGVAGAITAAVPGAGMASTLGANAGGNVIGGVTERIIASGGQSVGTLGDVAMDAAGSVVGDGVAKGVGAGVRKVGAIIPHPFRKGGSHVTTTEKLKMYSDSPRLAGPGGMFISPSDEMDHLLARTQTRGDLEVALGLTRGDLEAGMLVRIDVQDPLGRGLRLPSEGNVHLRPGTGLTTGNVTESVIDSPLRTDPGLSYSIIETR